MCFFSPLIKFSGSLTLDPSLMSRAPTWLIVLLYAVSSVLWVVAASYIISITLDDPVLRSRAYLAKELILVAISTALFYILLKIGKNTPSAPGYPSSPVQPTGKQLLMLLPLAMVAPLVSIGIVNMYGPEIEREAYADLQTIVTLKRSRSSFGWTKGTAMQKRS